MSTVMWQIGPSQFRIQTDDPRVARNLSRRKSMGLVAWGMNIYLRVFQIENMRPDNARRMLNHILAQENN